VGSADWMPRNFFKRIEVVFPIEEGALRERVISEILAVTLSDNARSSILQSNGSYKPIPPKRGVPMRRSQTMFIELALGKPTSARKIKKARTYPEMKLARKPI
jgi:polyphosphate kinase